MRVLAVIPARGGSKGIPRKNVLPIGGVPLIGRTVSAAKRCRGIDDVIVTTDDREIATIAHDYGAEVIDRPVELASDFASSESAILHACKTWCQQTGQQYDCLLLAQNTSPFHDPDDMQNVIDVVASEKSNSCITVIETYRYFWDKGKRGWHMPYQKRANRQNRQPWYAEAGSLYCVRYDMFHPNGNLFAPPVGTFMIPKWRAFEIDEPEDIVLANLLCRAYTSSSSE